MAALLGVHPNTVRRWDKEGSLKAVRTGPRGDRRFYRADALEAGGEAGSLSDLLTVGRVAILLKVHTNTVRRWEEKGLLKAARIGPGSHRRFFLSDIERLLQDRAERQTRSSIA